MIRWSTMLLLAMGLVACAPEYHMREEVSDTNGSLIVRRTYFRNNWPVRWEVWQDGRLMEVTVQDW